MARSAAPLTVLAGSSRRQEVFEAAVELYRCGMNVLPIMPGTKKPFGSWQRGQTTRLSGEHLDMVFRDAVDVDIAVICGRTSDNLCVIDADEPSAFQRIRKEMERRSLAPWIRSSTRGGHFWFRCSEGEVVSKNGEGYQILGAGKYAVAPPSIDGKTGAYYEWEARPGDCPPCISVKNLEFLDLRFQCVGNQYRSPDSLPPVAHAVLVEGRIAEYDNDNSRAEFAACRALQAVGWTEDEIMDILETHQPRHYVRIGRDNFRRSVLIAAMQPSVVPPRNNGSTPEADDRRSCIINEAEQLQALLDAIPFRGLTANSDKCVLSALIKRATEERSWKKFRASSRELALKGNRSRNTVGAALKRLLDDPLYKPEGKPILEEAGRNQLGTLLWSLHPDRLRLLATGAVGPVTNRTPYISDHDAFARTGIGPSCLWILRYLAGNGRAVTPKAIAANTGKALSTVYNALKRLAKAGLIQNDDGLWSAPPVSIALLNETAHGYRTTGKYARKAARFAEERREQWTQDVLAQLDAYAKGNPAIGRRKKQKQRSNVVENSKSCKATQVVIGSQCSHLGGR
jgi:hypothetical protein